MKSLCPIVLVDIYFIIKCVTQSKNALYEEEKSAKCYFLGRCTCQLDRIDNAVECY